MRHKTPYILSYPWKSLKFVIWERAKSTLFSEIKWDSGRILLADELTHSNTTTPLMPLGNKPFENTVGKGKIACNKQFLLFPQCFLLVWRTFCHFRQI